MRREGDCTALRQQHELRDDVILLRRLAPLLRRLLDEGGVIRSERWTYRLFETLSVDLDRVCERTQARFGGVRHARNHLRLCKIRIVERLCDIQNRRDRHNAIELVEPVASRLLAKFTIQNFRQLFAIGVTQG